MSKVYFFHSRTDIRDYERNVPETRRNTLEARTLLPRLRVSPLHVFLGQDVSDPPSWSFHYIKNEKRVDLDHVLSFSSSEEEKEERKRGVR